MVPPAGLEPTHPAPEAGALSTELRGRAHKNYNIVPPTEQAAEYAAAVGLLCRKYALSQSKLGRICVARG